MHGKSTVSGLGSRAATKEVQLEEVKCISIFGFFVDNKRQ